MISGGCQLVFPGVPPYFSLLFSLFQRQFSRRRLSIKLHAAISAFRVVALTPTAILALTALTYSRLRLFMPGILSCDSTLGTWQAWTTSSSAENATQQTVTALWRTDGWRVSPVAERKKEGLSALVLLSGTVSLVRSHMDALRQTSINICQHGGK